MTVGARNRTGAFLASQRPQPLPSYTQTEARDRRLKRLPVYVWPGDWRLTDEFAAICEPLAVQVAAAPNPAALIRPVAELADAAHQAVDAVVALLARADAERRTSHLGTDDRGRSVRALVDLAQRPPAPAVTSDMLVEGTWPMALVDLAQPYTEQLARLLGSAATPTVADRLLAALVEVDHAALALARRLDRDATYRANRADHRAPSPADRARADLEAMGVLQ